MMDAEWIRVVDCRTHGQGKGNARDKATCNSSANNLVEETAAAPSRATDPTASTTGLDSTLGFDAVTGRQGCKTGATVGEWGSGRRVCRCLPQRGVITSS
jgi:hypothetical protein